MPIERTLGLLRATGPHYRVICWGQETRSPSIRLPRETYSDIGRHSCSAILIVKITNKFSKTVVALWPGSTIVASPFAPLMLASPCVTLHHARRSKVTPTSQGQIHWAHKALHKVRLHMPQGDAR